MKKIGLYMLLTVLVLSMIGCACGRQNTQTGPENANFAVVVEDAWTNEVLQYFQAHTGYLPAVTVLNEETLASAAEALTEESLPAERADVLQKLTQGATCLLLKDAALIEEFKALGFTVNNDALAALTSTYRSENADLLGLTVVQMPAGAEINTDALKALVTWLTGAEAQYLAEHPDLLS